MYRSAAKPDETRQVIVLPPHRGRRTVLAFGLWFVCFWFLLWPVAWVVQALVTGEALWRLAVAPPVWLAVVWAITRTMRMETVTIGARQLRRASFLRDLSIDWATVTGVREIRRSRPRGGSVRLFAVEGEGGELLVAPDVIDDPRGTLRRAIDAAIRGDLESIDERVRAEGQVPGRLQGAAPHLLTGVILSVAVGALLWADQSRKLADRTLRTADGLPYVEKVAALAPLVGDDSTDEHVRCRAASSLAHAAVFRADYGAARARCAQMQAIGCDPMPWGARDCEGPFTALPEAERALREGDPARALELVRSLDFQGSLRNGIEVAALVALGRAEEARELAERCVRLFGESEDQAVQGFVARCREGL